MLSHRGTKKQKVSLIYQEEEDFTSFVIQALILCVNPRVAKRTTIIAPFVNSYNTLKGSLSDKEESLY